MASMRTITAGFIPLTDSMILLVAKEKGFAAAHDIDLLLSRELSWASIRDRIAVGHLDVAQMLAPMPIAMNAGLVPFSTSIIAPMALGLGGNAITVQKDLWHSISNGSDTLTADPKHNGQLLQTYVHSRAQTESPKLRFGVVHPYSGHNFELRYWLSSCGINPETDVEIVIVPPSLMPDALAKKQLDGYCVGEPWNSISVSNGDGFIITTKSEIWKSSPEKVLGVRNDWAESNPELLSSLIRALNESALWCGNLENLSELSEILSKTEYLSVSSSIIERGLTGSIELQEGVTSQLSDFMVPFERAANFPWQSHALWFYTQMVRWKQIDQSAENLELAKEAYRPDIYRAALQNSDAAVPSANMKVEGALSVETAVGSTGRLLMGPDGFFDGKIFDPDDVDAYIATFLVS